MSFLVRAFWSYFNCLRELIQKKKKKYAIFTIQNILRFFQIHLKTCFQYLLIFRSSPFNIFQSLYIYMFNKYLYTYITHIRILSEMYTAAKRRSSLHYIRLERKSWEKKKRVREKKREREIEGNGFTFQPNFCWKQFL